jgi:hypothetical protein
MSCQVGPVVIAFQYELLEITKTIDAGRDRDEDLVGCPQDIEHDFQRA